ncbi:unnamed protein product [Chrysoparadoxa australica]
MRTSQRGPVCKAMSGWHKATMDAQQARAQMAMAKRHSKTLYESRAFGTWKGEVSHSIYERAQMVANQRMEAVTRDIVKRYEKELGQVRAELASALTALSSERSRAHKMEEDMRRALLRGFSAMNMEVYPALPCSMCYAATLHITDPLKTQDPLFSFCVLRL